MNKTDWDFYYKKPYKSASFTRKITGRKIINLIKKHCDNYYNQLEIIELGGANSCFFEFIKKKIKPVHYKIIDNNKLGIKKFSERIELDSSISMECLDIIDLNQKIKKTFDLSFSVGLIEHFSFEETAKAISTHFAFIKKDGICIITFPTPTLLYKVSRKISEMLNMWIFSDERPLLFEEVENEVNKYGIILHKSITWPILFTQGVIVAKKK